MKSSPSSSSSSRDLHDAQKESMEIILLQFSFDVDISRMYRMMKGEQQEEEGKLNALGEDLQLQRGDLRWSPTRFKNIVTRILSLPSPQLQFMDRVR